VQAYIKSLLNLLKTALPLTIVFSGIFTTPVSADATGFLSLINNYRQQNGVSTLVEDQNLTNAACWFASDLGANNPKFDDPAHTDSQGRSMGQRLTDFGVSGSRAENIFSTTAGSSAQYAFDSWKGSSGHNTNMLNSIYTRIGIGRANLNGKWYWATDFANGSATSLTSQCGISTTPPSPTPPNPNPSMSQTPSQESKPTPKVETQVPAINLNEPTRSASRNLNLVEISTFSAQSAESFGLVKGISLGSLVLVNIALFGLVFWKLLRWFR